MNVLYLRALIASALFLLLFGHVSVGQNAFLGGATQPPEIGDERDFLINPWTTRTFTLRDMSDVHYLWVDSGELDRVTDSTMQALKQALVEHTPAGSYNSAQGIVENLHNIFGQQVNDDDGMTDILFYAFAGNNNLYDGYAPSPALNGFDVLFLNSNDREKSQEWMLGAVAHEYLHVIHWNYMDLSSREADFVAEGIAMVAMYVTGYSDIWFSDSFLKSADDLNHPLFELRPPWQVSDFRDHMRAGLFHTYLALQHGLPILREIVQNSGEAQGVDNLETILEQYGTSLEDALVGFYVANLLNEPSLGVRYSYPDPSNDPQNNFAFPALADIRVADTPSAFTLRVAGDTTDSTQERRVIVQEGGVVYTVWENVEDFELSLDVTGPGSHFNLLRARLRPQLVLERDDGSVELRSFEPGPDAATFTGRYERISLAIIHVDPEEENEVEVAFAASWNSIPVATEENELPDRVRLAQNYPNPFNPSTSIEYSLSRATPVRLAVYDVLGRETAILVDVAQQHPGSYQVQFHAEDRPSGTYIVRLETDHQNQSRAMQLLR